MAQNENTFTKSEHNAQPNFKNFSDISNDINCEKVNLPVSNFIFEFHSWSSVEFKSGRYSMKPGLNGLHTSMSAAEFCKAFVNYI